MRIVQRILSGSGWLIVTGTALSLSAYSLYWIGRKYGLPIPLAAIVSASFDGAAIVCADLTLKYARSHGDSGLAPRLGVLALAGMSAYLNMQHAVITHDPSAARILYAMPPVIAVMLFEFHTKWERRGALRKAGRVPASLPVFGRWAWLLFPFRTLGVIRRIVSYRLKLTETNLVHQPETKPETLALPQTSNDSLNPAAIRAWARMHGIEVKERGRISRDVTDAYMLAIEPETGTIDDLTLGLPSLNGKPASS